MLAESLLTFSDRLYRFSIRWSSYSPSTFQQKYYRVLQRLSYLPTNISRQNKISRDRWMWITTILQKTIPSAKEYLRFMVRNDFRIPFSYNDWARELIILDSLREYFFPGAGERGRCEGDGTKSILIIFAASVTHTYEARFSTPWRLSDSVYGVHFC